MVAQRLSKVITKLEAAYAAFYDIPLHTSANFFLSSSISDKSSAAERSQGVVYFREDGDDIDISVILSDKIIESLEQLDPHEVLNNSNLNAFCVVVEEISHFHLILSRKAQGMPLTMVELEWQAEIDKLLFSAVLLYEQYSFPHLHHLFRIIFDNASIVADSKVYEEATKHAARLWSYLASALCGQNPKESPLLRSILQQTYRATWQEKLKAIERIVVNG